MTEEEMHIATLLVCGPPPSPAIRSLHGEECMHDQMEWAAWWSRAYDQMRALGVPHADGAAARFYYWCRKQEQGDG